MEPQWRIGWLVALVLLVVAAAAIAAAARIAPCPQCENSRVVWRYESGIAYVQRRDYPGLHVSSPPDLFACNRCRDRRRVTPLDRWLGRPVDE